MCAAAELERALEGLAALVERYAALERIALAQPGHTSERRDQLREVSARFPGALRELDAVGLAGVRARAAAAAALLDRVRATRSTDALGAPAHLWARALLELTPRLRRVLDIKAWLAEHAPGQSLLSPDTRARLRACYPDADDGMLDRIASPPGGQVQQVAYQDTARALGVAADELKRILYGD